MEFILDLIYIYVIIFSFYFFVLAIKSLNSKRLMREKQGAPLIEPETLCVILYVHNQHEALTNMLKMLFSQDYPVQNFIIHVILDNCNDHSEDIIPVDTNIRVLNLNDGVTVGKSQAISILLESIREDKFIKSYVFVDVDRYIEKDFLTNVNAALNSSPVITGQTVIIDNENMNFSEKMVFTYTKYMNKFIRKSRALLKLSDKVDGNLFAIRKDFVEQVDALDIKDINAELKYSILLSSIGYPCLYVPYVKAYVKPYNYKIEKPSLSYRLKLFKQCFKSLFSIKFKFIEHILSLVAPSALVISFLSVFYLYVSYKFYFMFNFIIVFAIFSVLLLSFAISIVKSEMYAGDFWYLMLYPIYSIGHIISNFPPCRFVKKYFFKSSDKKNVQKYTVKVLATNGKSNIPCKLDFISENGLAMVVFSFKKKKFKSSKQIRIIEALNELTTKLNDYGFQLKICYCCEYFQSLIDGSQNMIKGTCNYEFKGRNMQEELQTFIWNSCSACVVKKTISIIEDIRLNQRKQ